MGEVEPLLCKARAAAKAESVVCKRVEGEIEEGLVVVEGKEAAPERFGLYLQYFAVGILYGGVPATIYGLFLGYFNVPGYAYSSALTLVSLPWSWKLAFGALTDCCPLFGYRRKPYMVLGWTICAAALMRLSLIELPEPYWCPNETHTGYVRTRADGDEAAEPCNRDAAKEGGRFALWLMAASFGYCVADVAADGLTVQLARAEPPATRGQTQTTVYLVRSIGNICAVALVGICMNSWQYNGTFRWGLSFPTICSLLALPAAAMIPTSWLLVREPCYDGKRRTFRQHAHAIWDLLRSKAMFYVVLFEFCTPLIAGISTTASGEVKTYWAGVKAFQNALFTILGYTLFACGLALVKSRLLSASWRQMTLVTTVALNVPRLPLLAPHHL